MSKFDEKLATYQEALNKLDKSADMELLRKITKGLGPSIYNSDSNKVACSQPDELKRVVTNFCVKKLGVSTEEGEAAVNAACAAYTERAKHRPVFYYMVVKHLNKESVYA